MEESKYGHDTLPQTGSTNRDLLDCYTTHISSLMLLLPRQLCQFSVNAIFVYEWHICVKYWLLLIDWECVWNSHWSKLWVAHVPYVSARGYLVLQLRKMGSWCCVMYTTGHGTPRIKTSWSRFLSCGSFLQSGQYSCCAWIPSAMA